MSENEKSVTITVKPKTYQRLFELKKYLSFNEEKRKRVSFDTVITYLLDKV